MAQWSACEHACRCLWHPQGVLRAGVLLWMWTMQYPAGIPTARSSAHCSVALFVHIPRRIVRVALAALALSSKLYTTSRLTHACARHDTPTDARPRDTTRHQQRSVRATVVELTPLPC